MIPIKIKLIVYDFDGVMTDNKVYVDQNGIEMVQVNRADGLGVAEIKKLGIEQIVISTEKNSVVSARAKKLDIFCLQGIENKKGALINYCQKNDYELEYVAYVGNDINDIPAFKSVGFPVGVADCYDEVIPHISYITNREGGSGAVREICDVVYYRRFQGLIEGDL